MNFVTILFYLFSFILISSSLVVVSTRNMVHGVMFLILAFLNAAALFILIGAEFIGLLLIVVYVGAIAVLFLFVVMMMNVDRNVVREKIGKHAPILICVTLILFLEIFLILKISSISEYKRALMFPTPNDIHNTNALGNILYTDFFLPFQIAGAILFVAMVGAIVLTLRQSDRFIRKQKIITQVTRTQKDSLEIVKVKPGQGIDL